MAPDEPSPEMYAALGGEQDREAFKPIKDGEVRTPEDFGICTTESALKAAQFAARAAQRMASNSTILGSKEEESIARFSKSELKLGQMLGIGGFSLVYEVKSVTLEDGTFLGAPMETASTSAKLSDSMDDKERELNARYQKDAREFVKKHCVRGPGDADSGHPEEASHSKGGGAGDARYAVKFLRPDKMADPRQYKIGAADLVVEAKFLSCLEHPNIVKMRGVTSEGTQGFATGEGGAYFLLMDRLYETLQVRILSWRKESKKYKGVFGKVKDMGGTKKKDLLIRQLCVAFDVAGALRYLHDRGVIYRDLKPQNLAFDVRGDVKLFDFGMAKELQEKERVGGAKGDAYNMTGNTGSIRYMAPEVGKSQPYNLTADVYSFGTMLWDILMLKKWWEGFNPDEHKKMVVEQGIRPSVPESWPAPLQSLVKQSWSPDRRDRPSMENVYNTLRKLIVNLRGGDDAGLEHRRRRSTFVMQMEKWAMPDCLGSVHDVEHRKRRSNFVMQMETELDSVHDLRDADSA